MQQENSTYAKSKHAHIIIKYYQYPEKKCLLLHEALLLELTLYRSTTAVSNKQCIIIVIHVCISPVVQLECLHY